MADKPVDDLDKDALKIGDYVLFKDVMRGLFLGVEGILLEDVAATEGLSLEDSIFCVHLQRQYSASRDLNAFLENYGMDAKKIEDESAKKYLLALERGLENEKKLNDTYMHKKHGQKVAFGDIIQLFHVKSGKYLTIIPDKLANIERENVTVTLDVSGNAFSWLQVYPRFKIDKEGDRVLSNAEIYLKVAERANEFVHTADRPPLPGHHREVNCALESTSWRLKIYQRSSDSIDRSILLASQLVVISDPETRSNLTIARRRLETLEPVNVLLEKPAHIMTSGDSIAPAGGAVPGGSLAGASLTGANNTANNTPLYNGGGGRNNSFSGGGGNSVGGALSDGEGGGDDDEFQEQAELEHFHDFGDIILEPIPQGYVDSNHLWIIESSSLVLGGPIRWKNEQVRFKHLNSGQYLVFRTSLQTPRDDGEAIGEKMVFTTTREPSMHGTLFSVNEINSTKKLLSNGKALQIGAHQSGVWVQRGEVLEDSVFTFMVKAGKDRLSALSLIINRCTGTRNEKDDSAGAEDDGEPMDVFAGISARNYLRKYHDMTIIPRSDSISTVWPTALRSDMEFFNFVVDKTVFFSQGFPISATGIQLGIDKADAGLRKLRQNLLREQNTLEVILRMINKLVPITERLEKMKNSRSKRKKSIISDEEISMINMGQSILRKCFQLLYYCILDNQENQMYVADFMPILLAHLNAQPLAGKCVTEMLSKNLELQETKIGTREIQIFVDKLRSSKMNAMYLQLLQSCCSCEGKGVDGNQCKVASMLFSNTNDIIINLHADYVRLQPSIWEQPSLYIPPAPIAGSPVLGYPLITKGLPQLSLAWTTNSIDFSPLGLFGKLSVNVEELFKKKFFDTIEEVKGGGGGALKKMKSKKKSSAEQKEAVANYFIAEMFLGAEMCMDRNYVAMHKLDALFPYEVLVTILKLDVSPSLKSAAVRLMMCLHIDRDPQATSKIPLLTRCWSDIKKNTHPQLPYVDNGRRYVFGLIQQIISEHVREMAGNRWDELSRHMLKMLRTLVEFNFYGTNDRMKDVIGPLIAALDRRKVISGERMLGSLTSDRKSPKKPTAAVTAAAAASPTNSQVRGKPDPENSLARQGSNRSGMFSETVSKDPLLGGGEEEKGDTDYMDYTYDDLEERSGQSEKWYVTACRGCYKVLGSLLNVNSAARVIALLDDEEKKVESFKSPIRYSKAPIYELETMVEAVDILAFTQRVIEDRNISLLLHYFHQWQSGDDTRSPSELFEQVVADSEELSLDISDFDNVMIDVLMFVHTPLVQSALEVLMAHHSMRRILLDNANNVQLLASHGRERQYKLVDQMLKQLEQNAETHELWGELGNNADHAVNKQTKDILKELTDICRVRRVVLEFDEEFMADVEIQNLFRNLGCFDICMKVMGLLDSVEEDEEGNLDEVAQNTRHLCLLCNTLLYWFFLGNAKNQEQGYEELEFFLDTLDDEINSHLVVKAIFKNNESLMRRVPHSHLADLVDKIVKNGKSPHYLALFAAISHAGEKNIVENQFEIVKTLTSPGRLQKVACFFVPVDHPEYDEKRELMKPFLGVERDLSLDDLPPLLAYHLMFLEVLSGCTVGRMNITTVEAKVQSVFNFVDMVESILDPGTITLAKTRLSLFFYNSIIEVELKIPGLEQSAAVWKLLETYRHTLSTAKAEIEAADNLGWESPQVSRQKIEYILVCIMIIGGFFTHYYQSSVFQPEDRDSKTVTTGTATSGANAASASASANKAAGQGKVHFSLSHVDELIVYFFSKIKEIHDLESPRLSEEMKTVIFEALETLNKSTSGKNTIVPYIKPLQSTSQREKKQEEEEDLEEAHDPEKALISNYRDFLGSLAGNTSIQYQADNENVAFISILEGLPFIADAVESDVRYETLIRKLVFHIRENIKIVNNTKRLDARVTKTSTWIIRAFRTMIENRMGMSIYERDDEGGQEQDEACAPVVNALNTCGATALCLDLIADGIDEGLQLEAVKLGVGLLFKEGGALEVQGIMHTHLTKTNSELFFKQVRLTLQKLQAWHTWNGVVVLEEGEEPKPPDEILIVRFLQLMCEGHYLPNQDIMREQPNNSASHNLLDDYVNYLNCLSRIPCRTSTVAGIRLSATILEVIQGPCDGNQAHFALNTELIETLNRLNRAKLVHDCAVEEEIELKKTAIDIFQGLLEGQGEGSAVYERVLSVIHLDIIQMMSVGPTLGVPDESSEEPSEEQEILQTECVVLLQMLCNFKPSLYDELGISRNIEDIVGSGTAMIEVIWRGDIHRRFFHVPAICDYLAKSSKDALLVEVDRSNPENKLIDFLNRSHVMYREVKHQQLLTELGISGIFSRTNQDRATWITFILCCVINTILLAFYNAGTIDKDVRLEPAAALSISVLNLIQAVVSGFVLLLFLVVRIPVKFQTLEAEGNNYLQCVIQTAMEPMTMYYIWYLMFSILGQVVEYDFLPFLLMDIIVKNSTTKDVLNAVLFPRQQIIMGGVVTLFLVQIYAFFLFLYFRDDFVEGDRFCDTLYGCYKVALGYGLRGGGGVGDIFNHTIAHRWWLDLTYFLVINVVMLNLVGGVIITTFGQLREDKARMMEDTVGVCFICGIDKQVFDRASDEPDGFKTHVKVDHNMWNYMYFIFMLWEQDRDDDDGLEQYVRRAIDANEITWFPLNKAIRLDQAASVEESLANDLKRNIQRTEHSIAGKLDKFQTEINIVLEQLNQTLKADHFQEGMESRLTSGVRTASRHDLMKRKDINRGADAASEDSVGIGAGAGAAGAGASNKGDMQSLGGSLSMESIDGGMFPPVVRVNRPKLLMVELREISGLKLPEDSALGGDDGGQLTCSIAVEGGTPSKINCDYAQGEHFYFYHAKKVKVMEDAMSFDERLCTLQIIFERPDFSVPIASVEIPVAELLLAEGTLFELFFRQEGESSTEECKLKLVPSVVQTF